MSLMRRVSRGRRAVERALVALALHVALPSCTSRPALTSAPQEHWVGTWTAPAQLTEPRNLPPSPGLAGSTLRQVIHVSLGGARLRLRFSNRFGNAPVIVARARLARSTGASAIDPASDRAITFGGRSSVTITPGSEVTSDVIDLDVPPLSALTVSLHFGAVASDLTGHPGSRTTSHLQAGDWTTARELPDAARAERWYILTGADVVAPRGSAAVVTLGNSITDGRGSGTDKNNRWPDNLARRLHADPRLRHIAVLNAGIGGNAIVRGGLGPTALERLDRDVLDQRGARWLIVLHGVNDIGEARDSVAASRIADELIAAYREIITRSRARGLRVYGATMLPFGGSFYSDAAREVARERVNAWIRTSSAFDAVIDFDATMRDPAAPGRLRAEVDVGDHLHPNEAGYRLMADAIDLSLFLP
jgi:lysophospholipase L1-like esterase